MSLKLAFTSTKLYHPEPHISLTQPYRTLLESDDRCTVYDFMGRW